MPYVLGIDIGTSFTAAATTRIGEGLDGPSSQPLNLGRRSDAVPSVIFFGDDGRVLVGEAAERRGVDQPDRMVREFKRRVGDTVPVIAGDLSVAPEDIFATMTRWVVDRAEEREGGPPDAITLTHPASWGGYKLALVREALAAVGLADVTLMSEPAAAALHYASQERVNAGSTIAVYDLGGGTFDIAILEKTDSETFDVRGGTGGNERLGGADFDEAVFAHVTASVGGTFPQPQTTDPTVVVALTRLRRECIDAKEALSFDSEASIPVLLPGMNTQVRIVRSEFESMIRGALHETIEELRSAIKSAGVDAEDLAAILLIGGSSRIPLVAELLSEELNRPIAIDADPKASISLGAAASAAFALREVSDADAGAGDRPDGVEDGSAMSARRRASVGARVATLTAAAFAAALLVTAAVLHTSDLGTLISGAGDGGVAQSDLPTRQFVNAKDGALGAAPHPNPPGPNGVDPAPGATTPPAARSDGWGARPEPRPAAWFRAEPDIAPIDIVESGRRHHRAGPDR